MNSLNRLTCLPNQSAKLLDLGIFPACFLWQILQGPADNLRWRVQQLASPKLGPEQVPAWTKAELDVFIGPKYAKPDLWQEDKQREKAATDPFTYPVFFLHGCEIFENGAHASARGLIWLLENEFVTAADANERYRAVFIDMPKNRNNEKNRMS